MRFARLSGSALALGLAMAAGSAQAQCVTKGAIATSGSAQSAKWFALETMVQSVSWGLWPSYVATSKVPGYAIRNEHYVCNNGSGGVTCRGRATFCKR